MSKLTTGFYRNDLVGPADEQRVQRGGERQDGRNPGDPARSGAARPICAPRSTGAIAARLIARADTRVLRGSSARGTQATLQAKWVAKALGIETILVWARDPAKAATIGGEVVPLAELVARADLIVTTTPAKEALITADMARPGLRIVAVGCDTPGKSEIAPEWRCC